MSLIIPPGYALISHHMRARAATRQMTFTIGVDMRTISAKAAALDTYELSIQANGEIFGASSFSSDYFYLGITATIGTEDGPLPYEQVRDRQGTATFLPVPPNSAILVRKVTNRGGKRNRGRFFMPPAWLTEANIDHLGDIDANLTTIQSYVTAMYDYLEGLDMQPVLLHAPSDDPDAPPPPDPTGIVRFDVQRRVATQRKRMR